MADVALVERARAGDRDAFSELASEISGRLYALALRVLRDADAAGDALQMTLVQIWRDLPNLRDPERFDAWASRIVVRSCQSDRRRARRSVANVALLPTDAAVGDSQVSVAVRDELERAFRLLTHEQRAVLVLLYYQDLTITQAADVLGVAPGTVKSRLHYARQAMRAAVESEARSAAPQGRSA